MTFIRGGSESDSGAQVEISWDFHGNLSGFDVRKTSGTRCPSAGTLQLNLILTLLLPRTGPKKPSTTLVSTSVSNSIEFIIKQLTTALARDKNC